MNGMSETPVRSAVRVELACFWCGHSLGDVLVRSDGRPTYRDVRDAIQGAPMASPPDWDAHGAPRCPRCRGKLFMEKSERPFYAAR